LNLSGGGEQKTRPESLKLDSSFNKESIIYVGKLVDQDWYYEGIDRITAEKILSKCKEDSFLVRSSSLKNHFAVSLFNSKNSKISHTLIVPLVVGNSVYYQLQDTARMYGTVLELVSAAKEFKGYKPVAFRKNEAFNINSPTPSSHKSLPLSKPSINNSPISKSTTNKSDFDSPPQKKEILNSFGFDSLRGSPSKQQQLHSQSQQHFSASPISHEKKKKIWHQSSNHNERR